MKFFYSLVFCVCFLIPLQAFSHQKASQLADCLLHCYHIDHQASVKILNKFSSSSDQIIDEFIAKSQTLTNGCCKNCFLPTSLPEYDPIFQAGKWHEILYENATFRVLWGVTQPGEQEPFHKHCWKSLMVIVKGATFEIEGQDHSLEKGNWPEGVYELPADTQAYAYKNTGSSEFQALRFEFKN